MSRSRVFPGLKTIVYLKRAHLDSAAVLRGIPLWKDSADSAYMNSTDSAHTCNSDAFFPVLIA